MAKYRGIEEIYHSGNRTLELLQNDGSATTLTYVGGALNLAKEGVGSLLQLVDNKFQFTASAGTSVVFGTDSADGSDNRTVIFSATNTEDNTRSGFIRVRGNEAVSDAGEVHLIAGDVSGPTSGRILLQTSANNILLNTVGAHDIVFSPNASERARFSSTGLIYNSSLKILNNTLDASDTGEIMISGGGGENINRGAVLELYGNEKVGESGNAFLRSGTAGNTNIQSNSGSIILNTGGINKWQINNTGHLEVYSNSTYDIGSSSLRVRTVYAETINANSISGAAEVFPVDNNTFITWRNAADDANLDVLKADTNDDIIINRITGKNFLLQVNGATQWRSDSNRQIFFDGGDAVILADSSDGADNRSILLAGGGGTSQDRGAYVGIYGNEHAQLGQLVLLSGDAGGGISVQPAGTERWKFFDDGTLQPIADSFAVLGDSTKRLSKIYSLNFVASGDDVEVGTESLHNLKLITDSGEKWRVDIAGHFLPFVDGSYDIGTDTVRVRKLYVDDIDADVFSGNASIFPLSNNTYATWRNFADTLDLDVIKLDTNDDVVLSSVDKQTRFYLDATSGGRYLNLSYSSGDIVFGTTNSGIKIAPAAGNAIDITQGTHGRIVFSNTGELTLSTSSGQNIRSMNNHRFGLGVSGEIDINSAIEFLPDAGAGRIRVATTDGADDMFVEIHGGGGSGDADRGAHIQVFGNEHTTNAGQVVLKAGIGGGSEIFLNTSNTNRWKVSGSGHLLPITDSAVDIGENGKAVDKIFANQLINSTNILVGPTNSSLLQLQSNGIVRWHLEDDAMVATQTTNTIRANTSDAADNAALDFAAGGAATTARGAVVALRGNEHTTEPGDLFLQSGSTGQVKITTSLPNGYISFANDAGELWRMEERAGSESALRFQTAVGGIWGSTSDGSDDGSLILAGGGDPDLARGAVMTLWGNESSGAGGLDLQPGDLGTARVTFNGVTGAFGFRQDLLEMVMPSSSAQPQIRFETGENGGYLDITGGSDANTSLGSYIMLRGVSNTILSGAQASQLRLASGDGGEIVFVTHSETERWHIQQAGHIIPQSDGAYDIGEDTLRVRKLYVDEIDVTLGIDSGSSSIVSWETITTTSHTAEENKAYITNNASEVTITLPASCDVGKIVRVTGIGAGGWKIAQNAGQVIHFGDTSTTSGTGGSIESTHQRDAVELVCVVADSEFQIISSVGSLDIV